MHTTLTGKDRRRGRPALSPGAPSVKLDIRLTGAQYDATCATARAARMSLSTYVRHVLRAAVDERKG
jgi:hypothetical protein